MVNVTVLVHATTNRHDLPLSKEPGRWRAHEFVCVYPYVSLVRREKTINLQSYLLHITGAPGTFEDVRDFLTTQHREADFPAAGEIERGKLLARSKRMVDVVALSTVQLRAISQDRQLDISWLDLMGGSSFTVGGVCRERPLTERPQSKDER